MLDLELLPLWVTTALVSILSLALIYGLRRLMPRALLWVVAVVLPFGIAYVLYWLPVWARSEVNKADYQGWEALSVGLLGITGALACMLFLAFQSARYRRRA